MGKAIDKQDQIQNLNKCLSLYHCNKVKPQRGAVLVISLIMLLLMTLIGTVGMQTTSLEEKMAGNMRNRNLAFQAAESALTAGESYLSATAFAALPSFNCTKGFYKKSGTGCAAAQPIWDTIDWKNANASVLYLGNLANVEANPRYIIEYMEIRDADRNGSISDVGVDQHVYRITARATGGSSETVVMLQSIYELPI